MPGRQDWNGDLWILVDGKNVFSKREIDADDGPFEVDLSLPSTARFLTLVSTEGQTEINGDWIVFARPELELLPADSTTDSQP
jgi:hypothetical protein